MKTCILLCVLSLQLAGPAAAQGYADSIRGHRRQYLQEFLTDPHSPLKAADTGFLRFYAPDQGYCVRAVFKATPHASAFDMATHAGKTKPYREYGTVTFTLRGRSYRLHIYQGLDLIKRPGLQDYLFIPFTDETNNETTYGGGRYLDLRTGDLRNGTFMLDFNKAYNPYCAYGAGYACPIPPDENRLPVRIEAGEQQFGKPGE